MSRAGRGSAGARDARVAVDAAIAFLLAAVLGLVPGRAVRLFGLLEGGSGSSVRIPGAILVGIGAASTLEHLRTGRGSRGSGWLVLRRST